MRLDKIRFHRQFVLSTPDSLSLPHFSFFMRRSLLSFTPMEHTDIVKKDRAFRLLVGKFFLFLSFPPFFTSISQSLLPVVPTLSLLDMCCLVTAYPSRSF